MCSRPRGFIAGTQEKSQRLRGNKKGTETGSPSPFMASLPSLTLLSSSPFSPHSASRPPQGFCFSQKVCLHIAAFTPPPPSPLRLSSSGPQHQPHVFSPPTPLTKNPSSPPHLHGPDLKSPITPYGRPLPGQLGQLQRARHRAKPTYSAGPFG